MRKYNHSQEQQAHLLDSLRDLGTDLLSLKFEDPANDEQMIRHHAYLSGKLEAYKELFEDNFPDPEPLE